MVEIFKGKQGGEYKLTKNGKKCYLSLIRANNINNHDSKMNKIDETEDGHTIPIGLLEVPVVIDRSQIESRIEFVENFNSMVTNTELDERERMVFNYLYEGLSQPKIAQKMHLSQERIRQITAKMARKLWKQIKPEKERLYGYDDNNIFLHRCLEKLPLGSEADAETFKKDRKKDIEKYGENSVYNLIPFGFPARKTALITTTFNICRNVLGGREFTLDTLHEMNPYSLRDVPGINNQSIELISKLHTVAVLENIKNKRASADAPKDGDL